VIPRGREPKPGEQDRDAGDDAQEEYLRQKCPGAMPPLIFTLKNWTIPLEVQGPTDDIVDGVHRATIQEVPVLQTPLVLHAGFDQNRNHRRPSIPVPSQNLDAINELSGVERQEKSNNSEQNFPFVLTSGVEKGQPSFVQELEPIKNLLLIHRATPLVILLSPAASRPFTPHTSRHIYADDWVLI
jgi:hypothetical protein